MRLGLAVSIVWQKRRAKDARRSIFPTWFERLKDEGARTTRTTSFKRVVVKVLAAGKEIAFRFYFEEERY